SSPPHKALRRDADVDSPSAARAAHRTNQPVKIQLIGDLPNHTANNSLRSNIYQCIKVLLTKENMHALPATYENIYNDCLWMVCVLNQGEGIYEKLRLELEQTVSRLSKELNDSDKADKVWIREFVKSCEWFETQLAFSFFIKGIFENVNLMEMLRRSVSNLLSYERKFRLQNTTTNDIPSVIYHLLTHQQYSVFEEYYADLTRKYYQDESKRLITEEMKNDAKKFFERVQSRIEEEVERAKRLLPVGSWSL
ncbi:Cullin repeat-like-containing domain protein, partial [Mycena sp. CBHHK59/15]